MYRNPRGNGDEVPGPLVVLEPIATPVSTADRRMRTRSSSVQTVSPAKAQALRRIVGWLQSLRGSDQPATVRAAAPAVMATSTQPGTPSQ